MLTPVTTTGIVIADIMVNPKDFFSVVYTFDASLQNILLPGIRLGAVGAYVYVLLELGRRTFRHDVTGQVAMWCWGDADTWTSSGWNDRISLAQAQITVGGPGGRALLRWVCAAARDQCS